MTDVDTVRLLIGDTDNTDQILSDADITDFLTTRSLVDSTGATTSVNTIAAAADCAGAIAAKYARNFDFSEDGQAFNVSQKVGHYQALESTLRRRQGGYAAPLRLAGTASI